MRPILSLLILFLCCSFSYSQVSWVGGSGKWEVASNWSTGQVPTSGDSVVIESPTSIAVTIDSDPKIKTLYIGAFDSLIINTNRRLIVAGAGENGIEIFGGRLIVNGELQVVNSGNIGISLLQVATFSRLVNNGQVFISDSGSTGLTVASSWTNNGDLISNNNEGVGISFNTTNQRLEGRLFINNNNSFGLSVRTNVMQNIDAEVFMSGNNNGIEVRDDGVLTHQGRLNIVNSNSSGIDVAGEFQNKGYTKIDGGGTSGISVRGIFESNDTLIIQNITGPAVSMVNNPQQPVYFLNNAVNDTLVISDCTTGISLSGAGVVFENKQDIKIDQCIRGIDLTSNSEFKNNAFGDLTIQNCTNGGIIIDNGSVFENAKDVHINDCGMNAIECGLFCDYFGRDGSSTDITNSFSACKIDAGGRMTIDNGAILQTSMINGPVLFDGIQNITFEGLIDLGN